MRIHALILLMSLSALAACDSDSGGGNGPADTCSGKSGVPGHHKVVTQSGGLERTYYVTVPQNYDATRPTPVVLAFHGYTANAAKLEAMTGIVGKAEAEGFIAVVPEGTGPLQSWNGAGCCGSAYTDGVDDVQFVRDMLGELEQDYCVDARRVFSTGMSNGGYMSNRLACELADQIAAIAPVVSVLGLPVCEPVRPVPIMMFNGTEDALVAFDGRESMPSVPQSFERWAGINGCDGSPEITFEKEEVTCESYTACAANSTTTLCTVEGGGHSWPGSDGEQFGMGYTTSNINATDAMWDFFMDHPMPE